MSPPSFFQKYGKTKLFSKKVWEKVWFLDIKNAPQHSLRSVLHGEPSGIISLGTLIKSPSKEHLFADIYGVLMRFFRFSTMKTCLKLYSNLLFLNSPELYLVKFHFSRVLQKTNPNRHSKLRRFRQYQQKHCKILADDQ